MKKLTLLIATTAALAATASSASAAGPRPDFQMPFSCSQEWAASTYNGHWPDQDSIDLGEWNGSTNMSEREPVLASADGEVLNVFTDSDGGNRVYLDHGDGWVTHYLHLAYLPPLSIGQQVAQGQVIGHVGNSGTEAMHLHYTQLADGAAVRIAFDGTLINTHAGNMASWNTWGTSNAEKLTSTNCPQETFTAFTQGGNPHFLNYKPGTGGMGINRINAGGAGVTTTGSESWSRSWTHFGPSRSASTRTCSSTRPPPARFVREGQRGRRGHDDRRHRQLEQGLDALHAARSRWRELLHRLQLALRLANLDKINAAGNGASTVWSANWGKGWTNLVPFVRDGVQYFLAYHGSTGAVEIDKVTATASGGVAITEVWASTWTTGYSNIVPVIAGGIPHLMGYKNTTGPSKFMRVKSGGLGVDILATETWAKGWSVDHPVRAGRARPLPRLQRPHRQDVDREDGPQRRRLVHRLGLDLVARLDLIAKTTTSQCDGPLNAGPVVRAAGLRL